MKDQFVTYAIAKRLKELGFNEPCLMYGHIPHNSPMHGEEPKLAVNCKTTNSGLASTLHHNWITLPLWQQAIDWLREKHKLHIKIDQWCGTLWYPKIESAYGTLEERLAAGHTSNALRNASRGEYNSYSQAREAVVKYTLELIK